MRIYTEKKYIVHKREEPSLLINGQELREQLKAEESKIAHQDIIYEVQFFAVAKEKRKVVLVDEAGDVVEDAVSTEQPAG